MKVKERIYSGAISNEVSQREIDHKNISRRIADEGVVLLKNDGLLPLELCNHPKISLYGNGAASLIKGGTGSGDVNVRHVVTPVEGFKDAGFVILNEKDILKYMDDTIDAKSVWKDRVLEQLEQFQGGSDMAFLNILANTKAGDVEDLPIREEDIKSSDAIIYIISRITGEGQDRKLIEGDFYLTAKEEQELNYIKSKNDQIILVINSGGQIDLEKWHFDSSIKSILYLSQPGMEAGHVLADLISGKVTPSGKLTTTWSIKYNDFPNAKTFSHCNADTDHEFYEEGIYVGYRYFDTFNVKSLYPFGYGLSYTEFSTELSNITIKDNQVCLTINVTNIGSSYSGKKIVQVYAACPQKCLIKELKRLVGFAKTKVLKPGESEQIVVSFDAKTLASYDKYKSKWICEQGLYGLLIGENAESYTLEAMLNIEKEVVLESFSAVSPLNKELKEMEPSREVIEKFSNWLFKEKTVKEIQPIIFEPKPEPCYVIEETSLKKMAFEIANLMTEEELIAMVMGEITKGQDNIRENELVSTGIYVPGAAGETSCRFVEKYGIPGIAMADGPAGLRLMKKYDVDQNTGLIYGQGLLSAMEGGILAKEYHRENTKTYFMFATAIPVGTMLAQTWNLEALHEIGEMIGREMLEFQIAWWLAPGMCIHRNPLCGRNFEYYSEDPLLTGYIASAITKGVQSNPGVGTTIKHFACNNQEDNRLFSDSIISERALREIYIRGFEIAIKQSQPMCIMSSYNKINGVPAANNYDLITKVARNEWGFKGIVMSDWITTTGGSAVSYKCIEAGNDLIMPGHQKDVENIKEALTSGTLKREKLVECAARIINILFQTIGMEGR